MTDTIEASLLTTLSGLIASFSDMLTKMFSSLEDNGYKVKDGKQSQTKDGRTSYLCTVYTAKDHEIRVKLIQASERENVYDLYMIADTGKKYKKAGIYCPAGKDDDKIENEIQNFIEEEYGEDSEDYRLEKGQRDINLDHPQDEDDVEGFEGQSFEETKSSKKLQITLSKIEGSEEIELGPIYCNYEIYDAYNDINNVLESEDFSNFLTTNPTAYEISQNDNEYDVEECDHICEMDTWANLLIAQYQAIFTIYAAMSACQLNIQTDNTYRLDDALWSIQSQLSWVNKNKHIYADTADGSSEQYYKGSADKLKTYFSNISIDLDTANAYQAIENYCLALEMYRPNFPEEVQQLINEWLLTLRYNH